MFENIAEGELDVGEGTINASLSNNSVSGLSLSLSADMIEAGASETQTRKNLRLKLKLPAVSAFEIGPVFEGDPF